MKLEAELYEVKKFQIQRSAELEHQHRLRLAQPEAAPPSQGLPPPPASPYQLPASVPSTPQDVAPGRPTPSRAPSTASSASTTKPSSAPSTAGAIKRPVARPLASDMKVPMEDNDNPSMTECEESDVENEPAQDSGKYGVIRDPKTGEASQL